MRSRSIRGPAPRGRLRNRDGFTVLEAVMALLILGLALTPLLGAVHADVREQGTLRGDLEAVSLAESRMSELAIVPRESIGAYVRPRRGAFPAPFGGYSWEALLRPEPASPALVRGAVLVRWKGGEYSLETVFHRPDLLPEFSPVQ
jgi:hypothetical protein